MREVIDLFKDHDTLDEIGVGSIRDAFADLLFPGLSTVQTRARYFLLIPWVYRRIEDEHVPSARAGECARRYLTDLISALERGGATASEGIIGWEARRNLQRLPSAVYWSGLGVFGIRRFHGSAEEYHRSLDSYYLRLKHHSRGEGSELAERLQPNWTHGLPETPPDLWKATTLKLSPEEAGFLRERMILHRPDSLLAAYLRHRPLDLVSIPTPWDHPAALSLPEPTHNWLQHARLFSQLMHGAALAYNLMLAERAKEVGLSMGDADLIERYRSDLDDWLQGIRARWDAVIGWNLDDFWRVVTDANSRIPHTTQVFAKHWIGQTRQDPERVVSLPDDIRSLIRDRERRLKGGRARLANHRALEMWSGASGTSELTFRWSVARNMLTDIHDGIADA